MAQAQVICAPGRGVTARTGQWVTIDFTGRIRAAERERNLKMLEQDIFEPRRAAGWTDDEIAAWVQMRCAQLTLEHFEKQRAAEGRPPLGVFDAHGGAA